VLPGLISIDLGKHGLWQDLAHAWQETPTGRYSCTFEMAKTGAIFFMMLANRWRSAAAPICHALFRRKRFTDRVGRRAGLIYRSIGTARHLAAINSCIDLTGTSTRRSPAVWLTMRTRRAGRGIRSLDIECVLCGRRANSGTLIDFVVPPKAASGSIGIAT
jgi:hypothetical protein